MRFTRPEDEKKNGRRDCERAGPLHRKRGDQVKKFEERLGLGPLLSIKWWGETMPDGTGEDGHGGVYASRREEAERVATAITTDPNKARDEEAEDEGKNKRGRRRHRRERLAPSPAGQLGG